MIKKFKNPTTGCFPVMGWSGGVETKRKQNGETSQYTIRAPPSYRAAEAL